MSTNQPTAGPEELLAHAGFLGGLVRTLVFDQEQAEDYLQDTWAYALAKPPRSGPGLKTWLATAARNYIRQDRRSRDRRTRRETVAARPERISATDEALAREEARRRVVDAVRRLKEPYRTAIVLRFLEDLPPREIAKREAVPVETVRTRIKRGLALLRNELDDKAGGDRRTWCVALLPLTLENRKIAATATAVGAGLLGGIALMGTKLKVALAAVLLALLLGVGLVVLSNREGSGEGPVRDPDSGGKEVVMRPDEPTIPADPDDGRAGMGAKEQAEPEVEGGRVGFAFSDDGRLISAEEVVRRYEAAGMPMQVRVVSEKLFTGGDVADLFRTRALGVDEWAETLPILLADGELRLGELPADGRYRLLIGRPNAAPMLTGTFAVGEDAAAELAIPLPREPDLKRYRLVAAEDGAPLAGATVTPWFEFGDDTVFIPGPALTADGQGEVEIAALEDAVRGKSRQPTWWIETETHLGKIPGMSLRQEDRGNTATIEVPRSCVVTGTAWLSNGAPAAGRVVIWTTKGRTERATVAEDGTFRVAPVSAERQSVEIAMIEDLAALRVQVGRARPVPGETVTAQIGKPAGSTQNAVITGTVTVGGKPLAGAFVITRTEGAEGGENFIVTAADGTYRKEDVAPGKVRVQLYFGDPRVVDDFYLGTNESLDLAAGNEKTLDFDLPGGAFEVTVVDDATGEPIPGAVATGLPMDREAGTDRFPGFRYQPGWGLRVGEDGQALLLAMVPGEPHRLRAMADGYQKAEVEGEIPGTRERPARVTVRLVKGE